MSLAPSAPSAGSSAPERRWHAWGRELSRIADGTADPRIATWILGAAMAIAAALLLWLGRGTVFSGDEMAWITASPDFGVHTALLPHGGHLILVSRLVYKAGLELFGLAYLPYRILTVATILLTVGLVFAYLRRRVGAWAALAPCLILLVFGSAGKHMLLGNGFTVLMSVALGVAALLALERGDRRGDIAACAFLILGVATYSNILPFVIGVGVLVCLGSDRWRRIWIAGVPLALYLAWRAWLEATGTGDAGAGLVPINFLLIPNWVFQSLSGVLNALTGLGYDFGTSGSAAPASIAGPTMAVAALVGLGARFRRGPVARALLAAVTIALVLWAMQALVGSGNSGRFPGGDSRYMYPGAVVVLLVAADAARGWRPRATGMAVVFLIALVGVATNLILLRDEGRYLRQLTPTAKSYVGALQLIAAHDEEAKSGDFDYAKASRSFVGTLFGMAVQPYGTFGYSRSQIKRQDETVREGVDEILVPWSSLALKPPAPADRRGRCRDLVAGPTGSIGFTVPARGARLEAIGSAASLKAGMFADTPTIGLGTVEPGSPMDLSSNPSWPQARWLISATGPKLRICRLR